MLLCLTIHGASVMPFSQASEGMTSMTSYLVSRLERIRSVSVISMVREPRRTVPVASSSWIQIGVGCPIALPSSR